MAQIRIADLPTAEQIDAESYILVEKPGFNEGTFKGTVASLQEAITVTAKVEQVDKITKIEVDDINGHTEASILTPTAKIVDNGDNTATIIITDTEGVTTSTIVSRVILDQVPTQESDNFLTSGSLYTAFAQRDSAITAVSSALNTSVLELQAAIAATNDNVATEVSRIDNKIDESVETLDNKIDDEVDTLDQTITALDTRVTADIDHINEIIDAEVTGLSEKLANLQAQIANLIALNRIVLTTEEEVDLDNPFQANGMVYSSLASAVLNVPADGSITLLSNAQSQALIVPEGKNFTLDLKGYRLVITGPGVGPQGIETNGLQLSKNSTITIKDGTLVFEDSRILTGIQNYSNLTLDNVTIISGIAIDKVISNYCGDTIFKNGTVITAPLNKMAFDVIYGSAEEYDSGANVTIEDESVQVSGRIEFGKSARASYDNFKLRSSITCPIAMSLSITILTPFCSYTDNGDGSHTLRFDHPMNS